MQKNIRWMLNASLFSMILIGITFIGFANSNDITTQYAVEDVQALEEGLPDYGPQIYEQMEQNKAVIKTMGKIPQIDAEEEKQNWLKTLDQSGTNLKDQMQPYVNSEGPIISYGINYQGYLTVNILEGVEVNDSFVSEIYSIFDKEGRKQNIEEIPVVFQHTPEFKFSARDSLWPTLFGGIKVRNQNNEFSTLGFAAVDPSTGQEGFLVAGHTVYTTGGIGSKMYQPYVSSSTCIGTVDRLEFQYADAAFIEDDYRSVDNQIYYRDINQIMDVTSYDSVVTVGEYVRMSGVTTGLTSSARITDVNYIMSIYGYPNLYEQCLASYPRADGDSGAPVFRLSGTSTVQMVGMHSGYVGSSSVFSPVSGIYDDLNVRPLTY